MAWLRMPFGKVRDQKLAEDPMGSRIYGGGNFWLKGFLVVVNKDQADKQKASQVISKPDDQKVASKCQWEANTKNAASMRKYQIK